MRDRSTNLILFGIAAICFGGLMSLWGYHGVSGGVYESINWLFILCMVVGFVLAAVGLFTGPSQKQ
jgi:di/tricarboxylate transporter